MMARPVDPRPPAARPALPEQPPELEMHEPKPDQSEQGDDESRLADLLQQAMDRVRQGKSPELAELLRDHQDLAEEFQQLWGAVMLTEALAQQPPSLSGRPVPANLPKANQETQAYPQSAVLNEQSPSESRLANSLTLKDFGDYRLLAELGRGGMGVVFKAQQCSLGRIVALKLMLQGDQAPAEELVRFRREAEAAARLSHAGIVQVFEVGDLAGEPYFTMEYISGTTLAKRLANGPLPPRVAAELLQQVCRAVHYAHGQGVLHRDLKPSNILIDHEGQPLVTDFGLAKSIATDPHLTYTGAILGTPSYMAPEQAAGMRGEVGPRSDVYSLGVILYEMLSGRSPFQAASPVETLLLVLEQDPLPPRFLNPQADRDLEMIALRALQKPAELRYASAQAMADDLGAYLAGEPVSARSAGFGQVLTRLFRETHHVAVLENWGALWIWHSVVLLVLCLITFWAQTQGVVQPWPYLVLWAGGLAIWGPIFWALRHRSGPVTFVERQIAHVWGASMIGSILLFVIEMLLKLPVLTLSPVLGVIAGMVFLVKAGILTGAFYVQAAALFATAGLMACFPSVGLILFGVVSALSFFVPGLKYYRQRHCPNA